MIPKKLENVPDLVNTYYSFVLTVYACALFLGHHTHYFWLYSLVLTSVFAAWAGYQAKDFYQRRTQRHGFQVVSDEMTYELHDGRRATLHFSTRLKAGTDHLMVYPIGYQWTGDGQESVPVIHGQGQTLLSTAKPYELTESTQGKWHYWFVAINPAVHKGETVDIDYSQDFEDKKHLSKPSLYYFVRVPMSRLELKVKFPTGHLPKTVKGCYIKSSDPSKPSYVEGVKYDPHKQLASWTVDKPKKGYCYRIEWS